MNDFLEKVEEFNKAFGVQQSEKPDVLTSLDAVLRHKLMKEENDEYLEACLNNDLVEILDACVDQLYILCGTILKHGLQDKIKDSFNEVHRSNMSKLDENGKPVYREDGKIIKSHLFSKPDLAKILKG